MLRKRKPVITEDDLSKIITKKLNAKISDAEMFLLVHQIFNVIADLAKEGNAVRVEPIGYIHYSKELQRNKYEEPGGFLVTKRIPFANVKKHKGK